MTDEQKKIVENIADGFKRLLIEEPTILAAIARGYKVEIVFEPNDRDEHSMRLKALIRDDGKVHPENRLKFGDIL